MPILKEENQTFQNSQEGHKYYLKRIKIWIEAFRLKTLTASISPVLIGASLAYNKNMFSASVFICVLFCSVLIQIGTNLSNDYYDFKKGADTNKRKGPRRATQSGLIAQKDIKFGFALAFFLSLLPGAYLIKIGGLPVALIGVAAILSGYLYTGGPFPTAYSGLSEIFVILFFGPIASLGTYYAFSLNANALAATFGFSTGLMSTAILTVNNLRDLDQDKMVNKKTLAVRFGSRFARAEYVLCVIFAHAIPVIIFFRMKCKFQVVVMVFLLLQCIPMIKKIIETRSSHDLNNILSETSKKLIALGILISAGLAF